MTQNEMIIDYMKENGSITQMDAIIEIGCTRLPSRICEIKKSGIRINKEMIPVKNRFGSNVYVARYSIGDSEEVVQ